ncbi:MAG TPA: 23S rRNA (guanosine(2251)-2'-O)-methyltransferase RlmB [Candidatus Hydrogenedentes bacterium]|nr:23S rRNA (guanosine(2251)-2'-O)-methyltransferase RlmB [Candidatus Hydrogenedentota bacterium]
MVQARKSRKGKKKLASSHNKSWIWGRHAVLEILEAGRWPVQELLLGDSLDTDALDHANQLADALSIRIKIEPSERLRELARTAEHQGYLAKMKPFPYTALNVLDDLLQTNETNPAIAILDRIQDPHNFGAIVRSAEVLGIAAVIIGVADQAEVTPAVARASAGAVNHIPIIQVDDLTRTVADLSKHDITLIAATEKGTPLNTSNAFGKETRNASAIILGNEGEGISKELLNQCAALILIPRHGKIQSLNVAAAAAILFYEATRNR